MKMPHDPKDWREARRIRAWELHKLGWAQRKIAEAFGVSEGAVSQWFARARDGGGKRSLRTRKRSGRPRKLSPEQLRQLAALLDQNPKDFGFTGEFWTSQRVAILIRRTFGVSYHRAHVSRLVRELGFSVQKPAQQAAQRNKRRVAYWKKATWPRIKKRRSKKVERLSS